MSRALVVLALLLLVPGIGHAQCSVRATPVNFGTYLPFSSAPTDSVGNVAISCALFAGSYVIELGKGTGGSFAGRRMRSGSAALSYQLYINAAHSMVWGDGSAGTTAVSARCCLYCENSYPIYGRIPAPQSVGPGAFIDTIMVTVTF